ncbi:E3 ubiquitin-protein ligase makorin-1 isoform X2 [Hyperolius riggenbachi]|uniref:E3 ubiquitin-protein ligase makorin-1 isoform X2 n=1 Tax=Hyperolius riggenbachi TaxID=752182 RepID=UPI0035A3A82A
MAEAAAVAAAVAPIAAEKSPLPAFPDIPPAGGWTRKVTCRYFMHGVCKEGNNCRYLHDLSIGQSSMICSFYQLGCCSYGDQCRYVHSKPLKQEAIGGSSAELICPLESFPESSCSINSKAAEDATVDSAAKVMAIEPAAEDVAIDPAEEARTVDLAVEGAAIDSAAKDAAIDPVAVDAAIDPAVEHAVIDPVAVDAAIDLAAEGATSDPAAGYAASDPAAEFSQSEDWVNAVEFVPGQRYCGRANVLEIPAPSGADTETQGTSNQEEAKEQPAEAKKQLCRYAAMGECCYGESCIYVHGDTCDMCGLEVLHPSDMSQRSEHIKCCIEAHEKDMELSFAVQRSKDIQCGICMEVVYEKTNPSDRRFGILSNCNHSYCLRCIRRWRSAKQFESKIIKSCPECRITSNFVIPSEYWVEEKEDKQKLILKYKEAMSNKSCRYFDEGRGTCPFGGNCFYKHAYPDGRIEEPQPRQKGGLSSRYQGQRGHRFWNFEDRDSRDPYDTDDDDVVTFELGEMLLMLLAAGADDDLSDSEDDWDLFHEDLDNFYDLDL